MQAGPQSPGPQLCSTMIHALPKVGICTESAAWLSVHWAGGGGSNRGHFEIVQSKKLNSPKAP